MNQITNHPNKKCTALHALGGITNWENWYLEGGVIDTREIQKRWLFELTSAKGTHIIGGKLTQIVTKVRKKAVNHKAVNNTIITEISPTI